MAGFSLVATQRPLLSLVRPEARLVIATADTRTALWHDTGDAEEGIGVSLLDIQHCGLACCGRSHGRALPETAPSSAESNAGSSKNDINLNIDEHDANLNRMN